ncbi:Serine/arginine-rich splicing factor RS40-like protein [Drosera capensis]
MRVTFDSLHGFAFVYMDDERDAEVAIRKLDRIEFGRKGRRLRVEWTEQERETRRPGGGSPKPAANTRPSKTLFVINFDPMRTRERDLERHFDPYGKISNVRIRKNFGFIQFETQADATRALKSTNLSKLGDRVITVEYAIRDDDDDRGNGYNPDNRGRAMSPDRGIAESGAVQIMDMVARGGALTMAMIQIPAPRLKLGEAPIMGGTEVLATAYMTGRSPPPRKRSRSTSLRDRSPPPPRGRSRSPPRRERVVSPPQRERSLPSPRKKRLVSFPRGERYVSSPQRDWSVSPPRRDRSVLPPRRDWSSSSPQREISISISPPVRARDTSPRHGRCLPSCVDSTA